MTAHRRVYLGFFLSPEGWACNFLEADLKTPIGRIRTVPSEAALRDLIARTPTVLDEDEQRRLVREFANGRGAVWLTVTEEQYAALRLG